MAVSHLSADSLRNFSVASKKKVAFIKGDGRTEGQAPGYMGTGTEPGRVNILLPPGAPPLP